MTTNTLDLYCDNVTSAPEYFDFSQGYAETWVIAGRPDFDDWDAEQCISFADDEGLTLDDNPSDYDRATLQSICESSLGMAVYDDEPGADLLAAVLDSVTAGDYASIDDWRDNCRDHYECCDQGSPMMNYRYPIDIIDENCQVIFDALPGLAFVSKM